MSLSNASETALLQHIFQNADWANIGDATGLRGSTTAGSFYIALYTADPGEAGTATTNEASYGAYARVAVARSAGGFTVSGNQVSNAAAVQFATCTSGSATVTHFAIVTSSSGAGAILASGALSSSLAVSTNIAPYFGIGTLVGTAD